MGPGVASVELVNMDCSVKSLAIVDGAFMHVVGKNSIRRGIVPYKVIARGQTGAIVQEQEVSVGLPARGKAAGLSEPQPLAECAR